MSDARRTTQPNGVNGQATSQDVAPLSATNPNESPRVTGERRGTPQMNQQTKDALADARQLRVALIEFELLMVHGLIPAGTENSALAVESWALLNGENREASA